MPNDREITEMLAKSFHLELDSQAQSDVEQNIENSDETAKFAQLSRMIQDSVADMVVATQNGDIDIAPGLSEAAKSRLRDSVAKAKSQTMSGTLLSDVTPTLPESSEGDSRNAESRFTLLRKIGEGGLGTVWLARDEDLKRRHQGDPAGQSRIPQTLATLSTRGSHHWPAGTPQRCTAIHVRREFANRQAVLRHAFSR